jgi:hypothetical protein
VPTLPAQILPCYLVLRWVADTAEKGSQKELMFPLLDPDGKLLVKPNAHLSIGQNSPPGPECINMILPFPLAFGQYGPHRIGILVNGEEQDYIDVTALPSPGLPPDADG